VSTDHKRPRIIGLTGSIGMGKSAVAKMFADEGIPVFDADAAVHDLQGPRGALVPIIEAAFPSTTGPDGVDRAKLGAAVFGNPGALKKLEAIVHPAVARERVQFLEDHADADWLVFDIPLLFEKSGANEVDIIVVVSAPQKIQRDRVLARPGMTESKFESILKLQMLDSEKRARADYVINTGIPRGQTAANIRKLVQSLRSPLAPSQK
jgi:dephospho-CoA kinase